MFSADWLRIAAWVLGSALDLVAALGLLALLAQAIPASARLLPITRRNA